MMARDVRRRAALCVRDRPPCFAATSRARVWPEWREAPEARGPRATSQTFLYGAEMSETPPQVIDTHILSPR